MYVEFGLDKLSRKLKKQQKSNLLIETFIEFLGVSQAIKQKLSKIEQNCFTIFPMILWGRTYKKITLIWDRVYLNCLKLEKMALNYQMIVLINHFAGLQTLIIKGRVELKYIFYEYNYH